MIGLCPPSSAMSAGIWQSRQLYISTPTSVHVAFADPVTALVQEVQARAGPGNAFCAVDGAVGMAGAAGQASVACRQAQATSSSCSPEPVTHLAVTAAVFCLMGLFSSFSCPRRSWPASRAGWTARPAPQQRPRRYRRSRCGLRGRSRWQVRPAGQHGCVAQACPVVQTGGTQWHSIARPLSVCCLVPASWRHPSPAAVMLTCQCPPAAGVRHSYLWLADCLGRPFLVSLRHPGLRLRCLAARGEISTARTIAERGEPRQPFAASPPGACTASRWPLCSASAAICVATTSLAV